MNYIRNSKDCEPSKSNPAENLHFFFTVTESFQAHLNPTDRKDDEYFW